MIFVQENRSVISESNPHLTALEVMKEVGQRWQNLSDPEKQAYNDKAANDKKRYKSELNKFEKEIEDLSVAPPTKVKSAENKSDTNKSQITKNISRTKAEEEKNVLSTPKSQKSLTVSRKRGSVESSGKKRKREKGKPRRPLSAYIYFSQEVC